MRLLPSIVKIIKAFQSIKYNFPVIDLIYKELNLPSNQSKKFQVEGNNDFNFISLNFNYHLAN